MVSCSTIVSCTTGFIAASSVGARVTELLGKNSANLGRATTSDTIDFGFVATATEGVSSNRSL